MYILDINSNDSKCKIKIIDYSNIEMDTFNKMIEHYSFKKQIDIDSPQLFCDHTQISCGYSICQKYDTGSEESKNENSSENKTLTISSRSESSY